MTNIKKIVENILIEDEIKIGFFLDDDGNETEETYEYKECKVVDSNDEVLEIIRYTEDTITVDEILQRTGIRIGITYYIV
jgi:hypothetical protein